MAEQRSWQRRKDLAENAQAYHAFQHFRNLPLRVRSLDRAYTICRVECQIPIGDRRRRALGDLGGDLKRGDPAKIPDRLLEANKRWKTWRRVNLWDVRCDDYDRFLEEEEVLEHREEIRSMNRIHAQIGRALMAKVVDRLNGIKAADISIANLGKLTEVGSKLERLARGKPTEIVERPDSDLDLSRFTEDELDAFTRLLEKARVSEKAHVEQ